MSAGLMMEADKGGLILFAHVDEQARHVEGAVGDSRLLAVLRPFQSETEARAALEAAGGENIRWTGKGSSRG